MKYKNIVVSGLIGSGTSTLANNLARELGWEHYSTGDFFRQYHLENNIPLWNASAIPEELDRKIDNYILEQLKNKENLVIDSHYGGWFSRELTDVFKILLTCSQEEIIKRVTNRKHTHSETKEDILERMRQLDKKFRKLYAEEDYLTEKNYSLKIDTTNSTPTETLSKVIDTLEKN